MDTDRNIYVYRYGQLLVALFIEKSNYKYLAGEYEERKCVECVSGTPK